MAHNYCVQISGLAYQLNSDEELAITDNFLPFMRKLRNKKESVPVNPESDCFRADISKEDNSFSNEGEKDSLRIDCFSHLQKVDRLVAADGHVVARDYDSEVIQTGEGNWQRAFYLGEVLTAVTEQSSQESRSTVFFRSNPADHTSMDINRAFHMIGWEKMLIQHQRVLLHSSCLRTEFGGILFSGPCGIGKSTQADLWTSLRQAKLINGDRTILHKEGKWKAYGSPFAGSSHCHLNESTEIRAIVMLEQAAENTIRRLTTAEAFHRLYAGMTVYLWDHDFVSQAVEMAVQLAEEVPVYLLACRPDERAVQLLESRLREEPGYEAE